MPVEPKRAGPDQRRSFDRATAAFVAEYNLRLRRRKGGQTYDFNPDLTVASAHRPVSGHYNPAHRRNVPRQPTPPGDIPEDAVFRILFLAFIVVPLLDLFVLLKIGGLLGFWPTVGLVLLSGAVGAALARWQGLSTIARIQSELAAGRLPAAELADGAMILVAAALLLTPGFLTDCFGILLLIPPARCLLATILTRYFRTRIVVSHVSFNSAGPNVTTVGAMPDIFEVGAESPGKIKYVKNEAPDGRPGSE